MRFRSIAYRACGLQRAGLRTRNGHQYNASAERVQYECNSRAVPAQYRCNACNSSKSWARAGAQLCSGPRGGRENGPEVRRGVSLETTAGVGLAELRLGRDAVQPALFDAAGPAGAPERTRLTGTAGSAREHLDPAPPHPKRRFAPESELCEADFCFRARPPPDFTTPLFDTL